MIFLEVIKQTFHKKVICLNLELDEEEKSDQLA